MTGKLPEKMRPTVESRMRSAYAAGSELEAKAQLETLIRELERPNDRVAEQTADDVQRLYVSYVRRPWSRRMRRVLAADTAAWAKAGLLASHI